MHICTYEVESFKDKWKVGSWNEHELEKTWVQIFERCVSGLSKRNIRSWESWKNVSGPQLYTFMSARMMCSWYTLMSIMRYASSTSRSSWCLLWQGNYIYIHVCTASDDSDACCSQPTLDAGWLGIKSCDSCIAASCEPIGRTFDCLAGSKTSWINSIQCGNVEKIWHRKLHQSMWLAISGLMERGHCPTGGSCKTLPRACIHHCIWPIASLSPCWVQCNGWNPVWEVFAGRWWWYVLLFPWIPIGCRCSIFWDSFPTVRRTSNQTLFLSRGYLF